MKPATMRAYPAVARRSPVNLAFNALLFSFLGWLILERGSLGARTGAMPHLINTLACAPLMACALRRFYLACPRRLRSSGRGPSASPAGRLVLAILFSVGGLFGIALGGGSVTLIVLLAAACCLTPWTAIRAHQQHLLLSFLAVAAGAAVVTGAAQALGLARREPSLMVVLPAVWCLWAVAAVLCISLYCGELLRKKRR
jgi:hypothetical protein